MSEVADSSLLNDSEAQRDARVLQVIIAAPSVRLIGAKGQRAGKNDEQARGGVRSSALQRTTNIFNRKILTGLGSP
jgi:hypothetical protein